ncbi:hypothetical protein DFR70_1326 [Nocardia tenerifensis]|uniref:Uncharacterized protein n=1 Tax=Nocardia tenerifensis TaxID=228006 RepID=A0A318K086_9NOCA|nr:DUF6301 family protein [Nocardia tenerifensis]PXX52621.1 hypothetical protein DFR70_1326 [Nocardia tenerifensis]
MHVDIEGTKRIARLAAGYDWSWTIDDLSPFCAQAGWEMVESDDLGASIQTDLEVSRPEAIMYGRNRRMDYFIAFVTDLAEDDTPMSEVRPVLDEGFADISAELTALFGAPARFEPGVEANVRWDLPEITIALGQSFGALHLYLKSPKYQARMDEPEPLDED